MNPEESNISPEEQAAALDPSVGTGSPQTAPWEQVPDARPTRKWIAARVTGLAAVLTMWATTGTWDTEETIALIGLLTEAAISYLTPNNPSDT